jgi:hypothetical protein
VFLSDGATQLKTPTGYCWHTVPGGHPFGSVPQQVLPTGTVLGRQHVVSGAPNTHNWFELQAMPPQQKKGGGRVQNGGVSCVPVNGLVPGQH